MLAQEYVYELRDQFSNLKTQARLLAAQSYIATLSPMECLEHLVKSKAYGLPVSPPGWLSDDQLKRFTSDP